MKKILLCAICISSFLSIKAQTTVMAPGNYKSINIGGNGYGDYTRNLILLHEIYNGTNIDKNFAVGKITAFRGHTSAFDRINVAEINSSASYGNSSAALTSMDDSQGKWQLKSCIYNGKKYLALDVPYSDAYHDRGYTFVGWTLSTGESMKSVPYMVSGAPVNQQILSDIQNYTANISETHTVNNFSIIGNVGIGTTAPDEKLAVNGKIHTKEVRVDMIGWPDYVFSKDYLLPSLEDTEKHIKEKGYLPGMPSAKETETNGVELGEMSKQLLKKVEEITLYLIDLKKENQILKQKLENLTYKNSQ
ncbi:hypothetical protein ACUN24_08455 [Pedobacter sp. WC2501]|uniref:hypothetical protein n=1 Tax=Pedobacter sp. WC2501 TaxID=3461400 RepID=UPI004045EB24